MSKLKNIAIVGGGASGVLIFYNLVTRYVERGQRCQITIFEKTGTFARGIAYSTTNPNHLLNVPAKKMSAISSQPNHFCDWLRLNQFDYAADDFVPRMLYGKYLEDLLETTCQLAETHQIQYTLVTKEVSTIKKVNSHFLLEEQLFDRVILAIGLQLKNTPQNFWNDDLKKYLHQDEIHVLGAGLTTMDALISLDDYEYPGKIFVHSRTLLCPQKHKSLIAGDLICPLTIQDAQLPLPQIFRKFTQACKQAAEWRMVFDVLRPMTQAFWKALDIKKKRQFMRHCFRRWNVHRHRLPPQQAARIEKLIQNGQLNFSTSKIPSTHRFINCSGFELESMPTLVQCLLSEKLVQPDELGMGIVSNDENLQIIGGLNFGTLFEIMAIPDIREQAYSVSTIDSFNQCNGEKTYD
jgi:uncharacterized NAD(P)/FAD-binding protein YdhS